MNIPAWGWYLTIGLMTIVLLIDIFVIARRPHVPSMREASTHLVVYVTAAVLFGLFVWWEWGGQYAGEFYAGWLTEYSLSVDNLFVFLLIMASFRVPQRLQQTALMIGIVIAIILRGVFIALGAVVINAYAWVFYVFGAFLIYTAIKLARGGETDDDEYHENPFLAWVERTFPATKEWHDAHLTVVQNGKRLITPMLIVILALGTTDLLFALDSIPAIYGLTKEPFLVLTANIFALMGLRQLYFLIGGLLKRLVYLSVGLAVLLGFIGIKLIMHALH
jgi:tellurite resistance protein TerC